MAQATLTSKGGSPSRPRSAANSEVDAAIEPVTTLGSS